MDKSALMNECTFCALERSPTPGREYPSKSHAPYSHGGHTVLHTAPPSPACPLSTYQQLRSTPREQYLPTMAPHHPLASVPPPLPPGWTEHLGKNVGHRASRLRPSTSPFLNQVPPVRYTFSIHLQENLPTFDPCPHLPLMHLRKRSRSSKRPFRGRTGSE